MPVLRLEKTSHAAVCKLDRKRTVVIATISPLEVHGPHLPIGQDYFEAYAFAEKSAELLEAKYPDWTFLLMPPIPVATDCVPALGSVPFPARLVRDTAYHALATFAKEGFARLAYSSFHGGPRHIIALEDAANSLTRKFGVPAASIFSVAVARMVKGNIFFDAVKDAPGVKITLPQMDQDHHAGFVETSVGLNLWPELVDDGWQKLPPSTSDPETADSEMHNSFLFGYADKGSLAVKAARTNARIQSVIRALKHFKKSTYAGYPAFASKKSGKLITDHVVSMCAEIFSEFIERGKEMDVHSPLWSFRRLCLDPAANKIVDDWLKLNS